MHRPLIARGHGVLAYRLGPRLAGAIAVSAWRYRGVENPIGEVAAISEPAPELDARDALRGVVSQLVINGEPMTVIIPGSVIEALRAFAELLSDPQVAGSLPSLLRRAMPWAGPLPEDDLRALAAELAEAASSGEHAPERVAALLREWRATAEAYADPDILAALTTPPVDCGPVPEPAR